MSFLGGERIGVPEPVWEAAGRLKRQCRLRPDGSYPPSDVTLAAWEDFITECDPYWRDVNPSDLLYWIEIDIYNSWMGMDADARRAFELRLHMIGLWPHEWAGKLGASPATDAGFAR